MCDSKVPLHDAMSGFLMAGTAPVRSKTTDAVIPHVQGDWGTQFGMLIEHIADTRNGLTGTTTEEVSDLQKLYKESKARFDESDDFKARARAAVTRLQSGEREYLEVLLQRPNL